MSTVEPARKPRRASAPAQRTEKVGDDRTTAETEGIAPRHDVARPDREFVPHPQRSMVLNELHARPFQAIDAPARIVRVAFAIASADAKGDRELFAAFCRAKGVSPPQDDAKHHAVTLSGRSVRWEQHSEFVTYTIIMPGVDAPSLTGMPDGSAQRALAGLFESGQPGPLLSAIDLVLTGDAAVFEAHVARLDPASRAMSKVERDAARIATDFRVRDDGFVPFLVHDIGAETFGGRGGMGGMRAGALVQRLLEIETYRTFALLGLPEAQRTAPLLARVESELDVLMTGMTRQADLPAEEAVLDRLTRLAAEIESASAASAYRFGASRAYHEIVLQRLTVIGEEPVDGETTLGRFLDRRLGPAMRTCVVITERQSDLAQKLARAAQLLRTRVDVAIARQNRDVLSAMNDRTRLQLRLQQTVEGLSVAAITYYVLGLAQYAFSGLKEAGWNFDPKIATALSLPVIVVVVTFAIWNVRRRHTKGSELD